MNAKTSKKMRGFMCHSTAATAVCTVPDPRSVILPRKPGHGVLVDNARLMNNAIKYSKLVQSHSQRPFHSNNNNNNNNRSIVAKSSPSMKREAASVNLHQKSKSTPLISGSGSGSGPGSGSDQVNFQVVVMRVSLHCQGCAGKVKKQLSKMEGVTSFSIDLETKKVTVMGRVSPIGVLESVSKVKKAEFWAC